jgi:hypothetical protein
LPHIDFIKQIRAGVLRASQFPAMIADRHGTFTKPANWLISWVKRPLRLSDTFGTEPGVRLDIRQQSDLVLAAVANR